MNAIAAPPKPLVKHGIFEEDADIRAHVCVVARMAYVFQVRAARRQLLSKKYPIVQATQPGVAFATADGWIVPPDEIPGLQRRSILPGDLTDWPQYLPESEKGRRAVWVVQGLIGAGLFPFWGAVSEPADFKADLGGTDLIASVKARIQVKCDYRGGGEERGGTGNLFLQRSECNPCGKY